MPLKTCFRIASIPHSTRYRLLKPTNALFQ